MRYKFMPMPINKDGQGPATGDDIVSIIPEVWDMFSCTTVAQCPTVEMASFIAEALNFYDEKCIPE